MPKPMLADAATADSNVIGRDLARSPELATLFTSQVLSAAADTDIATIDAEDVVAAQQVAPRCNLQAV